nr:hypothetical protein HK105_005808 [Polyrhizophydium stewartii]
MKVAQNQVKAAEKQMEELNHQMDDQKKEYTLLEHRQLQTQQKLDQTVGERDGALAALHDSEETCAQLRAQGGELRSRISGLEIINADLSKAAQEALEERQVVQDKNDELERIIGELMKYPETMMGPDFRLKDLELNNETHSLLRRMIESNNLRIMLLEKKNEQYRAIQLNQGKAAGSAVTGITDEDFEIINARMYDSHHPPRELMRFFRADELETIEHLNSQEARGRDDASIAHSPLPGEPQLDY